MNHLPSTKQIRTFLSVARHLQFTKAALELHMSQPAVTAQINMLEEQLGVRLFHRTKREVKLTAAGQDLLPVMESIGTGFETLMHSSADLGSGKRGKVRLAILPSLAASILPEVLKSFRASHPAVEVEVWDVVAEEILTMIRNDRVDLGIGLRLTPDRDFVVTEFVSDELHVFYPRDHVLAHHSGRVPFPECIRFPQIVTKRNSSVRVLLENALARHEAEITIAMEANYMSTALGAVRAGLGVALLPESAADAGSTEGLTWRPVSGADLQRRIGFLHRRGRVLSNATTALIRTFRQVAAETQRPGLADNEVSTDEAASI